MPKQKPKTKLQERIPSLVVDVRGADPKLLEALIPALQEMVAHTQVLGGLKIKAKGLSNAFSTEEAMEEAHLWLILGDKLPADFLMLVERGIVPVMRSGLHEEAESYSPVLESGNSFLFDKLNEWHVHAAMIRALENYKFPYDWQNLKNNVKNFTKQTVRLK
jgi:hypothetical protein